MVEDGDRGFARDMAQSMARSVAFFDVIRDVTAMANLGKPQAGERRGGGTRREPGASGPSVSTPRPVLDITTMTAEPTLEERLFGRRRPTTRLRSYREAASAASGNASEATARADTATVAGGYTPQPGLSGEIDSGDEDKDDGSLGSSGDIDIEV